jgi:amino-acid N-acetyltransferase
LPVEGLVDHLDIAIVARLNKRVVGCAALGVDGDRTLLRSVAVDAAARAHRVGAQVTKAALDLARILQVRAVFLLTTTAERFFLKFGFERIARQDVPESVQASVEFQSVCPSTAIVKRRTLTESAPLPHEEFNV